MAINRHEEIMAGNLTFAPQVRKLLGSIPADCVELCENFWGALWHGFLNEDGINGLFWADVFRSSGYEKTYRTMCYLLEVLEWAEMEISSGFCLIRLREEKILKWVNKNELLSVRRKYRLRYYKMRYSSNGFDDMVKVGNGRKRTGLIRKGFQKAGKHKFLYDTRAIRKYQKAITDEVTKKLVSGIKDVDYKSVVNELIADYASSVGEVYSLGANTSDSRGRAIFDCTKRVFNPISHKTARACIVLPKPVTLTDSGWDNVFLFIAELNHVKANTVQEKMDKGLEMSWERHISDQCDLHERIWLDRIYDNIERYEVEGWEVPISADVTACGIAILGTLTNDHHFMDGTNVVGKDLKDIWTVPGLSRNHVKKAITPILYGSSQTPEELWDGHDYSYTQKQVNLINKELLEGRFKNVLDFKEHIIGKVIPDSKMRVKIWDDEFDVYCNRFKWDATRPVKYDFLTGKKKAKAVIKETAMVPDLNAFKTYWVTALLHNLDSQIADYVCQHLDWVVPVHDDFISDPNSITVVRELYGEKLRDLYVNRHQVMREFLGSIGIEETYPDIDSKALEPQEITGWCLK